MTPYISEGAAVFLYADAQRYEDRARALEYDAAILLARIEFNRHMAALIRCMLVVYALRILEDDGCPHHE